MLETRPYQDDAVVKTLTALRSEDRVQLHMAPGSGKTVVALRIWQGLKPNLTAFFVPNIHLIYQTYLSWSRLAGHSFRALAVCSGQMGRAERDELDELEQQDVLTTTDRVVIAEFLQLPGQKVLFCTYKSASRLGTVLNVLEQRLNFAIMDEAHRTAGSLEKNAAVVLDDRRMPTDKRMAMTATPRYVRTRDENTQLIGMQDPDLYGRVVYTLPFRKAVEDNILCDYRVVAAAVSRHEMQNLALGDNARQSLALIATAKVIDELGLKRGLTFHSSIRSATSFARLLPSVFEAVCGSKCKQPYVATLNASHSANHRNEVLREVETTTPSLISNVRILGEGFDFSALDFIVMADPKSSVVEIIQNIGRVMRRHADKKVGTVVLPVLMEEGSDGSRLDHTAYRQIVQVATALRAYDEMLAAAVTHHRVGGSSVSETMNIFVERHVEVIGLSADVSETLSRMYRSIRLEVVRSIMDAPRSSEERLAELEAFVEHHSRLPSRFVKKERSLSIWMNATSKIYTGEHGEALRASIEKLRQQCQEQQAEFRTLNKLSAELGVTRKVVADALQELGIESVGQGHKGSPKYAAQTLELLREHLRLGDEYVPTSVIRDDFDLTDSQLFALRKKLAIPTPKLKGRYPRSDYNRIFKHFQPSPR